MLSDVTVTIRDDGTYQKIFQSNYSQLIDQEHLWTAIVSWAENQYFHFTEIDPDFLRDYIESVGVLNDGQKIKIYKTHSIKLTD